MGDCPSRWTVSTTSSHPSARAAVSEMVCLIPGGEQADQQQQPKGQSGDDTQGAATIVSEVLIRSSGFAHCQWNKELLRTVKAKQPVAAAMKRRSGVCLEAI
jgi:hypothetical protein